MDISKEASGINNLRKRVLKEVTALLQRQTAFEADIRKRFRDEYNRNNQSMDNLEDFYQLNYLSKKNLQSVKTAHNLLSKMSDLSRFEIQEEILTETSKG